MTNSSHRLKNDENDYVFVEFERSEEDNITVPLEEEEYDYCDDDYYYGEESQSKLSHSPSSMASVCSETMFVDVDDENEEEGQVRDGRAGTEENASPAISMKEAVLSLSVVSLEEKDELSQGLMNENSTGENEMMPLLQPKDIEESQQALKQNDGKVAIIPVDPVDSRDDIIPNQDENLSPVSEIVEKDEEQSKKDIVMTSEESSSSSKKDSSSSIETQVNTDSNLNSKSSRPSNKKRRKKMKLLKKATAAAAAAVALNEMHKNSVVPIRNNNKSTPTSPPHSSKHSRVSSSSASSSSKSGRSKRKASKEPKSAVACAAETLAAYRAEQNIKKPPNTLKLVSLL